MEVSQLADLDTHAIIGGGKAQSFGVSESAEFFTVLSDTLYRDKKRAVVREVICNAWDAHIMGGCTDRPVEIELTEHELVIRDFGPGIADSKMVPVYCIYGASTKVADEKQNGGFGLGCKAPFAYTDHFTVTSCHDGVRTVYAISRGGSETDGKPGLRTMVSVPTTESGLTVTIPIIDKDDVHEFLRNIRAVVEQGGILATLNGEQLRAYDYAEARKTGMAVTRKDDHLAESHIWVLYGTVLYPVSAGGSDQIVSLMRDISRFGEDAARYIVVAPPSSIGVTPSREALSNNRRTIATVTGLLEKLLGAIRQYGYLGIRALETRLEERLTLLNFSNQIAGVMGFGEFGVIADPKMIGERAGASNFLENSSSAQRRRLLLRVGQRKFRDYRRIYRRMLVRAGKSVEEYDYRGDYKGKRYIKRELSDTQRMFRVTARLHMRLAAQAGVLKDLTTVEWDGICRKIGSPWQSEPVAPLLVLGHTKAQLGRWFVKIRENDVDKILPTHTPRVIGLAIKRPTGVQRMHIRALAERFKIKLIELEAPVVVKQPRKPRVVVEKPEAPVEAFYDLKWVFRTERNRFFLSTNSESLTKPKYFIAGNAGFSTESLRLQTQKTHELARLFPETAVATSLKEKDRLERELGVKNVFDAMLDEFEKGLEHRDAGFVVAMTTGTVCRDSSYHGCSNFASQLARRDMLTGKLLTRSSVRITERHYRLAELWRAVFAADSMDELRDKRRGDLLSKANVLAYAWVKGAPLSSDYQYLQPILKLKEIWIEDWEAMRAVIKTLQALKKRAKPEPTETLSCELKEAA